MDFKISTLSRTLRTRGIKMLVLDEADEMLNKGFKEQIYDVYRYLPPATQVSQPFRSSHVHAVWWTWIQIHCFWIRIQARKWILNPEPSLFTENG